jgi:hypothetical protein
MAYTGMYEEGNSGEFWENCSSSFWIVYLDALV